MDFSTSYQGDRGFTLIELIIVIAVVGVTSALAAPGIADWMDTYRLKKASRQLATDLQFSRMRAISEKREYSVSFDADNKRYTLFKGNNAAGSTAWTQVSVVRQLADTTNPYYAKDIGLTAANNITFSTTGTASTASTYTLSTTDNKRCVLVLLTGGIRLAKKGDTGCP